MRWQRAVDWRSAGQDSQGNRAGAKLNSAPASFSHTQLPKSCNLVIWRLSWVFVNIGASGKYLRPIPKKTFSLRKPSTEEPAMDTNFAVNESYEISPRFQRTIEERVARLEKDADCDEAFAAQLANGDHIRRQMRLVAVQRAERSEERRVG